ncbi:MAG TPA: cell division protein ZapA [Candidatus Acidoferrum sp.]|nr:cell division protein ZapA [Candidatus Acidoferrum sp.]
MAAPSISISVMGREYQIACPPEEEEALRRAARYLDQQMEQMRNRSASLGYEKIAVLAALNVTHDFLKLSSETNTSENASLRDIKQLEKKIDNALIAARQIEI